jgi:hypothetical protein
LGEKNRERVVCMKRKMLAGLSLTILLSIFIGWTGCSTTKTVYNKIIPNKGGLKKRVLVLPMIDQAGLGEAKVQEAQTLFLEELKKVENYLVREATLPPSSVNNKSASQFDIIVDPYLSKKAEEMGMNVLITATIHPIDVNVEKKGIWPIIIIQRKLELSMVVSALDLTNGTLFMTNLESTKLKMEEQMEDLEVLQIQGEFKEEEAKNPLSFVEEEEFQEAVAEMIEDQASAIMEVLKEEPWSGKILSVDGKDLIINAGKDVGLITGSLFEVFGKGENIQSVNGRSYHLLGPKMGEIKAVRVMEDHASAVPWKGTEFKAGQTIRVKK